MNETQSHVVAEVVGGKPWQPYPGIWVVLVSGDNDSLVVIYDDAVREWDDPRKFETTEPSREITFLHDGPHPSV